MENHKRLTCISYLFPCILFRQEISETYQTVHHNHYHRFVEVLYRVEAPILHAKCIALYYCCENDVKYEP